MEPKIPFPSFIKKPSLSLEHINDIAELSAAYLKPEAAEFSEDELFANLFALYRMSKEQNSKVSRHHASKIHGLVGKVLADSIGFDSAPSTAWSPPAPMHPQKSGIMHNYRSEGAMHEQPHAKNAEAHMKEKIRALERELEAEKSDFAGMNSSFASLKHSADRAIDALARKNNDLQRRILEQASEYKSKMAAASNAYRVSVTKMNGEKNGLTGELNTLKEENRKLKKAIRDSLENLRKV